MADAKARAVAFKNEGNEFFKRGEWDAAIERYSKAVDLDPENHVFYSNRSAAYAGAGEWAKAAADGARCVELNAGFLKGYHRVSNALFHTQDYKQAILLLEKGLVHHPGNADLTALLRRARSAFDEAERTRRAGLGREEALKEAGNDLFRSAKFEEAIEKYTEAYDACADKTSPTALAIMNNRAACKHQIHNFAGVVEDTSHVLEHDPTNQKALIRRALAFEGLERYRSALADVRAVLAIDPTVKVANEAQHRIGSAVRALKASGTSI